MFRNTPVTVTTWFTQLLLGLLMVVLYTGCEQQESPVSVDITKRENVGYKKDPNTITYAYLPQYFHRVSFERHNPIVEHLRKETGLSIRQVFPDSFDDLMKMVGQGKIDFFFSNPFVYAKLSARFESQAFARIIELDGNDGFRGQIISRADNKQLQTLEDCRGKRWIAVDPSSAGGYLFGLGLFWDHGIHKEDFAEVAFVTGPGGQQEKVVYAVLSRRYDFGSVREGTLQLVSDKIDLADIRIISHTSWYPGWLFAARKALPPQTLAIIKDALVKLDQSDPKYQPICQAAHFERVIPAQDSDFDSTKSLISKVGLNLQE